jgi:hypothetical protein
MDVSTFQWYVRLFNIPEFHAILISGHNVILLARIKVQRQWFGSMSVLYFNCWTKLTLSITFWIGDHKLLSASLYCRRKQ